MKPALPMLPVRLVIVLAGTEPATGGPMVCEKCGSGYMVDDSYCGIRVYKCWLCGNRIYPDYPKRSGALVCSRCGSAMDEKNALSLCKDCMRRLGVQAERLKRRNYGATVCSCGRRFFRKSPTQLFHSKACRKRVITVPPSIGTL